MTTLVTGATGFIGGRLVSAFRERGDEVRALVRDPARAQNLAQQSVELATGDVENADSLAAAVEGVDRVCHCAAIVSEWLSPAVIRRVNVEGTRRLLDASAAAGVSRLIYLSSLAVLGSMHHRGTDESAPYRETGDAYSDSKIESERLVRGFAERGDVATVIVRPGFVYGPGDRLVLPRLIQSLVDEQFTYVGSGDKLLNIVYVDDVVQAVLLADEQGVPGAAYNVTDGTRTTLREFVTFAAKYLGLPPPKRSIPPAVAWALCYGLEGFAKLTRAKEPPRLNRARMKFLYYNQYYSIEKAKRELGYQPRFGYRDGLPPALDWVREEGLLPAGAPVPVHAS